MGRSRIASLEYVAWLSVCVALVAFLGAPTQQPVQLPRPSVPTLSQGSEPWDANLRLPKQSERVANYTMDVRLNTETNIISGWEILEWRNTTGQPQQVFPFRLYHNAWKNNRSTFAVERGWNLGRPAMTPEDYGYTDVRSITLLTQVGEIDLTGTLEYIQPDDGNPHDQTVFQIRTPQPIASGQTMRLRIEFETKQPLPISRTGAIRSYHFVAQWFPKIGVWWRGAWNCHQFHANTEFFADFGVYDVTITLPSHYVIGATGGIPRSTRVNDDGTTTYNFYQEDVHDFAWVAAPDLVRTVRTFEHSSMEPDERPDRHHRLRSVTVILLTQPHHGNLIERYFDATFKALRFYGEWYGEYPYETVTVVDPANGSRSGGMEYPTLFTGGGNLFAPSEQPQPESVTVHEFGHQFWYGLVANNEFEEAWLDEGFNSYSQERVLRVAWPPFKAVRYFFGGPGAGTSVGIPYVFHDVPLDRYSTGNSEIRRLGKNDVMARRGWEYYNSYGHNSYTKPAMSLMMLEQYLGEEKMYRVMRTYHHRYRFKHPTSQDFINVVNEVSGKDMSWFFEQTWFSSDVFDYKLDSIVNRRIPPPEGIFTDNFTPSGASSDSEQESLYECEVVVKREGEAKAPVEVLVVFQNGQEKREVWDGEYRWKKFIYRSASPVAYAVVDPELKLVMDINYNNNSLVVLHGAPGSLAAKKIASKWMFWLQTYLEFNSFWH